MAPTRLQAMENFGLPSALTKCEPPDEIMAKGNPNARYFVYSMAYGNTVSVEPKNKSRGFNAVSPTTDRTTPIINIIEALPPIKYGAFSFSPAPKFKLNPEAPPIPKASAVAIHKVVKGKATLVAAFPNSPTHCPIKI